MAKKPSLDKTLVSILTTPMRVKEDTAFSVISAYTGFCEKAKNNPELQAVAQKNKEEATPYVVKVDALNDAKSFEDLQKNHTAKRYGNSTFTNAPKNSILIIPVKGLLMRETYYTYRHGYIVGTRELESIVKKADEAENIGAIVFTVSCAGGQAAGNESLARVIKNTNIPKLVHYEGMASAALECFIGVDEIYANEKDSYFGSLGTKTTVINESAYWKSLGIDFIDINAPQSTHKNIEVTKAKEGDLAPMKELLGKSTKFFIDDVKKARPQIVDDGLFYNAKIYNSVEALSMKAIDGIKDFNYVLVRASYLMRKAAKANKRKEHNLDINKNSNSMPNTDIVPTEQEIAAEKAAKVAAEKAATELADLKKDASMFAKFKAFFTDETTDVADPVKQLETATTEIATLKSTIKTLEDKEKVSRETLVAEQAKLKAATDDLANLTKATTIEGEEPIKTVEALVTSYNKVLEHNKTLGGDGTIPPTPQAPQENNDATVKSTANNPELSAEQREKAILAEIEAKTKKTETEEKAK